MKVKMKKVLLVFGTRPEAIKMLPIIKILEKNTVLETIICVSGQHRKMLDQVLNTFNIKPDYDLNIMVENQSLKMVTERILNGFTEILYLEKPDIVLVHGDTTTAFAAALASYYMQIRIGHIEAGLRTYQKTPFPEEFNRVSIDHMSTYCFAPTQTAFNNLINEGISTDSIILSGNTIVDVFKYTIQNNYSHQLLLWSNAKQLILLTVHRRENQGKVMETIFRAVKRAMTALDNVVLIFPVHYNPKIQKLAFKMLSPCHNIKLIEPLSVIDFHNIMNNADLVITDSGGVQEEAAILHKPLLVIRECTERVEIKNCSNAKIIGISENTIYDSILDFLNLKANDQSKRNTIVNPFGDGYASERIVNILERID